jgi:cellulose synthase (UDP-forming)
MNPRRLLALWRERWEKPGISSLQVPYMDGRFSQWAIKFAQQIRWSLAGIVIFCVSLFLLCTVVLLPLSLSLDSQIAFSVFILLCALFFRLHVGILPTLILMGMSFIVSGRYLYWRVSSTIGQDFDAAFGFGFILFLAELYFCIHIFLNFIGTRWPIKRAQSSLRSDSNSWPNIDVFILCEGQSKYSVDSAIKTAKTLDWPNRKIKTYLLDDSSREDIQQLAESNGVIYTVNNNNLANPLDGINAALLDSKGDFVVLLECEKLPNKEVLQSTIGWFLRDVKLGLLLCPQHFLASEPSKHTIDLFHASDLKSSFAMLRRAMLLKLGDQQSQLLTTPQRMNKEMQDLGYEYAFVGLPRMTGDDELEAHSVGLTSDTAAAYFRVNQPVLNSPLLAWRLRLSSLQVAFDFYQPAVRALFMAAPLPYLLGGVKIIQADLTLIVAYATPHLLHWYIAKARLENKQRLSLWNDFKETSLAVYVLMLTFLTFIITEIQQFNHKDSNEKRKPKPSYDWLSLTSWWIIVLCNLVGVLFGVVNFPFDEREEWGMASFYIGWAISNLLILSAIAAVAEEVRHIRYFTQMQRTRSSMLRLPFGRSLMCVVQNFPDTSLSFKLPVATDLKVGETVDFSLFRGERELGFSGVIELKSENNLIVQISDSALADYKAFAETVYSRGKNWPKWLPGRDADSPLPRWLYKLFDSLRSAYLAWRNHYKTKSSLIQLPYFWKKKNDSIK